MQKSKKMFMHGNNSVSIIFITVIFALILTISITMAYFTSTSQAGSNAVDIQFGTVAISKSATVDFSQADLVPTGNSKTVTKQISIKNIGNASWYIRTNCTISIDSKDVTTDKISLTGVSSQLLDSSDMPTGQNSEWEKQQTDNCFFYADSSQNGVGVKANEALILTLTFAVNNFDNNDLGAKSVVATINLDAVQMANNGSTYNTINWANN